jgi:hypothetical protein
MTTYRCTLERDSGTAITTHASRTIILVEADCGEEAAGAALDHPGRIGGWQGWRVVEVSPRPDGGGH